MHDEDERNRPSGLAYKRRLASLASQACFGILAALNATVGPQQKGGVLLGESQQNGRRKDCSNATTDTSSASLTWSKDGSCNTAGRTQKGNTDKLRCSQSLAVLGEPAPGRHVNLADHCRGKVLLRLFRTESRARPCHRAIAITGGNPSPESVISICLRDHRQPRNRNTPSQTQNSALPECDAHVRKCERATLPRSGVQKQRNAGKRHYRVEGRELGIWQVPASKQRHCERPEHVHRNITQYCLQLLRLSHWHRKHHQDKAATETASPSTERQKNARHTGYPARAHSRTPPHPAPPGLQQRTNTCHRVVLFGSGTSANREGAHATHATDDGWSKGGLSIQLPLAGCPERKASHQEAHRPSPTW